MIVTAFRITALAEAASWTGLLVGMYLKHVSGSTDAGVALFGPIHGALFVAYVLTALGAARSLGWSMPVTLLALLASIPPLTTLVFERAAARAGLLERPANT